MLSGRLAGLKRHGAFIRLIRSDFLFVNFALVYYVQIAELQVDKMDLTVQTHLETLFSLQVGISGKMKAERRIS